MQHKYICSGLDNFHIPEMKARKKDKKKKVEIQGWQFFCPKLTVSIYSRFNDKEMLYNKDLRNTEYLLTKCVT